MKEALTITYLEKQTQLKEIESEISALEEKLKTPERTLDDLIYHMQLLKKRNSLTI